MRRRGFHTKTGYAVLAIPDSGLFVRDGEIVTGHETSMKFNELILFSREADAKKHAEQNDTYWSDGDPSGHRWRFHVVPVVVSERL